MTVFPRSFLVNFNTPKTCPAPKSAKVVLGVLALRNELMVVVTSYKVHVPTVPTVMEAPKLVRPAWNVADTIGL